MTIKKTIILSLGGSLIVPDNIDVNFLKKFRALLLQEIKKGKRFVIVTGGENASRQYQKAAKLITQTKLSDLDWIGIAATKMNAELVRAIFGKYAFPEILIHPKKKLMTNKKILIGSGWVPGFSSDMDAVLLAKTYGAKTVVNLSNIPYVYTADPRKIKSAKAIKQMNWNQLLNLTGRKWRPGAHVPFDPEASKYAKQHKMTVIITQGTNINNFQKILNEQKFEGTIIRD